MAPCQDISLNLSLGPLSLYNFREFSPPTDPILVKSSGVKGTRFQFLGAQRVTPIVQDLFPKETTANRSAPPNRIVVVPPRVSTILVLAATKMESSVVADRRSKKGNLLQKMLRLVTDSTDDLNEVNNALQCIRNMPPSLQLSLVMTASPSYEKPDIVVEGALNGMLTVVAIPEVIFGLLHDATSLVSTLATSTSPVRLKKLAVCGRLPQHAELSRP